MIEGFEDVTFVLTAQEHALLPRLIGWFERNAQGEANARKSAQIEKLSGISGPRLRKMIGYIRRTNAIRWLVATSKGYFITRDRRVVEAFASSLAQRAQAIQAVADAMLQE